MTSAAAITLFAGYSSICARSVLYRGPRPQLSAEVAPARIIADGHDAATLHITVPAGKKLDVPARVAVLEAPRGTSVERLPEASGGWTAGVRAGVIPGRIRLRLDAEGYRAAFVSLTADLDSGDRAGDGTPDFLRLDDDHDRQAFRRWFTFLAEAQYFQNPAQRPEEISDCAALIRYAYREALRAHEGHWTDEELPVMPGFESVAKYQYPYTPLGAALFRVRPGPFRTGDLSGGAFAQFADAQTLQRFNTHFITRELSHALPGDLLFYRQLTDHMPFHSMIYVGPSLAGRDGSLYVLYHTGPTGPNPGEIRRVSIDALMHHPEPRWRPLPGNSSFLGMYRWNILRGEVNE